MGTPDHAEVLISSDLAARRAPFIYAGYAESCRALYLGETRGGSGVLGRLAQHVSDGASNTFRQRVCAVLACEEVEMEGITFVAVPLSDYRGFWSDSPEYRRAVEYLVQMRLLNEIAGVGAPVALVSRVAANGFTSASRVVAEADRVTGVFARVLLPKLKATD